MTDQWWRGEVVYQIYPRSFADFDGDGVGDLRGIIDHLDYLVDLGVGGIWLSPIFESPMADFGYDISDHTRVDPLFGTNADAELLIALAHERGLRVVFDIILGHTSDQHPWFVDSARGRGSDHRDFYVWRDGPTPGSDRGGPPNNWTAGFPADTSSWTWHPSTEQWYLHSHLPEQPDLDWTNAKVRAAQLDVIRYWLDRGVDGLRLDSINRLGKDPEFRDNVSGEPSRQQDWPVLHDYLREVRAVVDAYPQVMTVGEVWEFDQRRIIPYLAPDELHMAHNFVFARAPFDATVLGSVINEFEQLAGATAWPAWFFNNHDEPRAVSRWSEPGDDEYAQLARGRVAAVLLLSLRGTPFLYQGEELGLHDTPIPLDRHVDPGGRDPQRTPLPWSPPRTAGPGAGFTDGEPWLPLGTSAERFNVETERGDPESMLSLYKDLLRLRRDRPSMTAGTQTMLPSPEGALALLRRTDDERTLILLNLASTDRPFTLDGWQGGPLAVRRLVATSGSPEMMGDQVTLAPLSAAAFDVLPRSSAS